MCIRDSIKGDGDDGQHHGGEDELIPQGRRGHEEPALVEEVAQGGDFQGEAQADVGDKDLVADGGGDGQSQMCIRDSICLREASNRM